MPDQVKLCTFSEQPAFGALPDQITWDRGQTPDDLYVVMAQDYGAIALHYPSAYVDANLPPAEWGVLLVSDYRMDEPSLHVPASREEVEAAGGDGTYQNELLAKGPGINGANTGSAHARHYSDSDVAAVRVVALPDGLEDICVGRGNNSLHSHMGRFLRHGLEYRDAQKEDKKAQGGENWHGERPGTDRAIARKLALYGGAVCALLPISPVIYGYQHWKRIQQPVAPAHVLAIGNVASPRSLPRIGTWEVPRPRAKS